MSGLVFLFQIIITESAEKEVNRKHAKELDYKFKYVRNEWKVFIDNLQFLVVVRNWEKKNSIKIPVFHGFLEFFHNSKGM